MNFPPGFPDSLKPKVEAAVIRAERRCRHGGDTLRVQAGLSAFSRIAFGAVKSGDWSIEEAYPGFETFLVMLCSRNAVGFPWQQKSNATDELIEWAKKSGQWLRLMEKLAKLAERSANISPDSIAVGLPTRVT